MALPIKYLNMWRNVKGRYDLMLFLCKWDPDYRKDVIITFLAYFLFIYSCLTWSTYYDWIAMAVEASIIMVQLGGELSILPPDYRPSHGGVQYSVQLSTHIAYDELSYLMSGVYPALTEQEAGFKNPVNFAKRCRESPLSSDRVDDALMSRKDLPYKVDTEDKNFIRSRHQLRYIAIRVANKKQHTTNGMLVALHDMADTILNEDKFVNVRKAFYFDALLTVEAFRSRIFRNNIKAEKEVYTDLTTYFPVKEEIIDGHDSVRFEADFFKRVSTHIGITTLLVTEHRRVLMLHQGSNNAVGSDMITFGGSGTMMYSDLEKAAHPADFRDALVYALAREMCEETGMDKYFTEVRENTMVTGFFRWIDRCGLPEFIGVTRAGKVPFSGMKAIDGDEVLKFDEVPVELESLADFKKVLDWVLANNIYVALSPLMALRRLVVISTYNSPEATEAQKDIYKKVSRFLFPPAA